MKLPSLLFCAALIPYAALQSPAQPSPPASDPLKGYVELHAHPLSNVGFGGKLVYGGVDVGSLLPADPDCNRNVRATTEAQALGHDRSTHGHWDPFNNPCGDIIREQVIKAVQSQNKAANESSDATGFPDFGEWPVWNDLTHQKMWVEWIRTSVQSNPGLRVMVALTVNNKTLADAVCGPCDGPDDDKNSTDLQLAEIKSFVGRHPDFMEVAYNSADLHRIVSSKPPKLAVVMGVEVDNIGNFKSLPQPPADAVIRAEIDRLYAEGARYIFPVHLLDNPFGKTATYEDLFNFSTRREEGSYWDMTCAGDGDNPSESINYNFSPFDPMTLSLVNVATALKLNTTFPPPPVPTCPMDPTQPKPILTQSNPTLTVPVPQNQFSSGLDTFMGLLIYNSVLPDGTSAVLDANDTVTISLLSASGQTLQTLAIKPAGVPLPAEPPLMLSVPLAASVNLSSIAKAVVTLTTSNPNSILALQEVTVNLSQGGAKPLLLVRKTFGMKNRLGLTDQGKTAINEMMRLGMLIDIDHMSDQSKMDALGIAQRIPGGYPLNSGHSGLRGYFSANSSRGPNDVSERATSASQYHQIASLHGMAGVGTGNSDAFQFAEVYNRILAEMQPNAPQFVSLGIGTDTDGFAPGMPPRCNPPIKIHADPPQTKCSQPLSTFPPVKTADGMSWDYNTLGVAHYGMLNAFFQDARQFKDENGLAVGEIVIANINLGAEYFYQTWKKCEDLRSAVN